ncbi:SH3 domain-containing protein [Phycomyces nitens]|nr:SH3 domain-containing protein [Phycomyces nitens]
MSEREQALATHVLESIQKELLLLKAQKYLEQKAYDEILALLPTSSAIRSVHNQGYPPAQTNPPPPAYGSPPSLGTAEALYDFPGTNPRELPLKKGEVVQVLEHVDNDWWRGSLHGRTGVFPRTYIRPLEPSRPAAHSSPNTNNSHSYGNYPSPPRNPPPQPQQQPTMPGPTGYNPGYGQAASYQSSPQRNSYQTPPQQQQQQQMAYPAPVAPSAYPAPVAQSSYPAPPEASAPAHTTESSEGRLSGFAKKFGGNVANAATWGFGATLGSEAAHSLF